MRLVDQAIVDDDKGDCLRACVCSLLDLNTEDVPNFAEMDFFVGLDKWLTQRGMQFIRFSVAGLAEFRHTHLYFDNDCDTLMLVWGKSPRLRADGEHRQHIVIVRPRVYGVELVHDPHSSRAGLLEYWGFGWIVPTEAKP
jgi:hypothetical protein